jgi:hypothetical protein
MVMPTSNATMAYATHFHAHITLYVDGRKAPVPALVGIDAGAADAVGRSTRTTTPARDPHGGRREELHANLQEVFKLGLRFNSQCIGGNAAASSVGRR